MRKSINKMVGYRVAAALISVVLFSVVTTVNIMRIKRAEAENAQAFELLNRAQTAEAAHYKWSSGLSNALYAGKEFTGSIDPTTCVLGQWLYGEAGTDNEKILALRTQIEPLHKELHGSATEVLGMLETNPIIRRPSRPTSPPWWGCWSRWWRRAPPSARRAWTRWRASRF